MLLWIAVACTTRDSADTDTDDSGVTDDTGGEDTGDVGQADEDLARALIAGDRADVAAVLEKIAWSGGWPVATDDGTFLFVSTEDADLAGDFSDWARIRMTEGPRVWWAEVAIEDPAGAHYKLVRDTLYFPDPSARSYEYDAFGQISFVRPPSDAYRLDRWPNLQSNALGPRDVRVYVPPGAGPWPTITMHDGQNLFDPEAFWGGWRMQETVAQAGYDVLIVGVDNTYARMDEYAHVEDRISGRPYGGEASAYATLITEGLLPRMEEAYGVPPRTAVAGSSMGGLVSLYVASVSPGEFDLAASLSGTLGWGRFEEDNATVQELYLAAGHGSTAIYVDSGGDDGGGGCTDPDRDGFAEDDPNDSDNYCTNRAFADALAGVGYVWDTDLWHWHEPGAPHNEAAWAERFGRVLAIFGDL